MSNPEPKPATGLGTFAGVFTPSILTILGLILFRRLGYVVGGAGLMQMLLILCIAHTISILTSTSLSAIATNMRVKGGGDYYLISRSLGVTYGGALGIVLYLAQSISVAFYCIGLGEAVALMLPEGSPIGATGVAAAATLFLFAFAWLGSDWATRLQYVVMAALVAALASFFIGGYQAFDVQQLQQNWNTRAPDAPGFWVLFALFFPAVTGFTQGVSMSGDLRNPSRSLPSGTFAAIFVSLIVYGTAAVFAAGSLTSAELTADYEAMNTISVLPALMTAGLVAATLSSALASFMGAPRILQALASDKIFPGLGPFSKGFGPSNNPRLGTLLTLGISLGVVGLGGVDVIAPVVSMFFLISYGLLNYATALEAIAQSPSFRPRFRWFNMRTSMLGAVACLGVMLAINVIASLAALTFLFLLQRFVQRISGQKRWSDGRRDQYFHAVRKNLKLMSKEPVHARNWRPHLLFFSDTTRRRAPALRFANWIEGGAGMTTIVQVLEGQGQAALQRCALARKELEEDLEAHDLKAFPLVVTAPSTEIAARTVIQSHGLGPLKANTILLNWCDQVDGAGDAESERLSERVLSAATLGVNVVLFDGLSDDWVTVASKPPQQRRIDIWWSPDKSGRLMLLLAYMMTRDPMWENATLRLILAVNKRSRGPMEEQLRETLEEVRIEAEVHIVSEMTSDVFFRESGDACMVFASLRMRGLSALDAYGRPVGPMLQHLPAVALVRAVDDVALDADPEQGAPGEMAALGDAARALKKLIDRLEADLVPAHKNAQDSRRSALKALEQIDQYKLEHPTESDGSRSRREEALERKAREAFQRAAAAERQRRSLETQASTAKQELSQAEIQLSSLATSLTSGKRAPSKAPA